MTDTKALDKVFSGSYFITTEQMALAAAQLAELKAAHDEMEGIIGELKFNDTKLRNDIDDAVEIMKQCLEDNEEDFDWRVMRKFVKSHPKDGVK